MSIKNVILDFGHGGVDGNGKYTTAPGKMHTFPDGKVVYEGVLNRGIGWKLYHCASSNKDLNIISTTNRDDPKDVSLSDRVKIANNFDPEDTIFISIHCNASPSHTARGFEIYTTVGKTDSDLLASCIIDSVEDTYAKNGIKMRYDRSDGDGDKESNFYVLRNTKCPAVLIECGFFDNKKDLEKLEDPLFQGDLASFIYTGILNYINGKDKKIR